MFKLKYYNQTKPQFRGQLRRVEYIIDKLERKIVFLENQNKELKRQVYTQREIQEIRKENIEYSKMYARDLGIIKAQKSTKPSKRKGA